MVAFFSGFLGISASSISFSAINPEAFWGLLGLGIDDPIAFPLAETSRHHFAELELGPQLELPCGCNPKVFEILQSIL